MPNIGWTELIVILVIALLVFGPSRLAGIGGALGKAIREFRSAVRDAENEIDRATASDKKNT
ncbi:MAG: twin-arginine translocase TatA/TatE family subunit [Armatimonadota bacterium]|nr:twin-arginine translocase TatA/TatE family subunit [Armatimonadota bacterium]MDR7402424.1 twin-arginine translocase TatA/TatE family subunit [Armatimonadota bacterium]MDR7404236.1 twin-arginine translocase TatA/TatE family subunit [Armatimonadota bacterium]MDR7437555.1 twin-arginine translocase TatA/TatE family subunit [Armatimonadota bacterium]MDR7472149.1 twin-arginine translocase TatA/TatE family subunit [Armatimonadota bacterium]